MQGTSHRVCDVRSTLPGNIKYNQRTLRLSHIYSRSFQKASAASTPKSCAHPLPPFILLQDWHLNTQKDKIKLRPALLFHSLALTWDRQAEKRKDQISRKLLLRLPSTLQRWALQTKAKTPLREGKVQQGVAIVAFETPSLPSNSPDHYNCFKNMRNKFTRPEVEKSLLLYAQAPQYTCTGENINTPWRQQNQPCSPTLHQHIQTSPLLLFKNSLVDLSLLWGWLQTFTAFLASCGCFQRGCLSPLWALQQFRASLVAHCNAGSISLQSVEVAIF